MTNHYSIYGGKILVFGDLHLSCTYEGQHKDYTLECYKAMDNIINKVKESKASGVFFLGDVVGVNERNVRDRQFLLRIILFFKTLNELTNGNVYSVKGNHDKGDFSDFDFLLGVGLLKNPSYVDYYSSEPEEGNPEKDYLEVRFHFVNYGEEERELKISEEDSYSNVVLGHADYLIDGVTNWYQHKGGVMLSRLANFKGVEMVISGHIHVPSEEVLTTSIGDKAIDLFYTGAIGRTAERINDCWYVIFEYDDGSTEYNIELFGLDPVSEVFYPKENFIGEEDEEGDVDAQERARQTESLTNLVKEIMENRMTSGDLFGQVRAVPGVSDEVKDIACKYLQIAIDKE